jgi:L-lysine 2,3-aminomutase
VSPFVIGGFIGWVVGGVYVYTYKDSNTNWLSNEQATIIYNMLNELKRCLKNSCVEKNIIANLDAMHISTIFEKGAIEEGDDTSETRNGILGGIGSRVILSADFFDRSDCRSQITTLIHESYHAGTEDWTERKSYQYADNVVRDVLKNCPYICKFNFRKPLPKTFMEQLGESEWERTRNGRGPKFL